MKKLFLLSLLFVCPWLAQASEVKHEAEQKQVARHEPLTGPDLGRLHIESRARHEVARKQVAQHEAVVVQDLPVPVVAASSAAVASQAVQVAASEAQRAQLRMAEFNKKHKADADALQKRIASGEVIPGAPRPAEELAMDDYDPVTWGEVSALCLYLAVPIAVLALGNGIVNNIIARRAGLGLKRWRSYRAPWWEFASGTVFKGAQVLWFERLFHLLGLNQLPAFDRWGLRLGTQALVLQPMIGLLQELGETIPLGKFGPGWRSRAIPVGASVGDRFYALDECFYEGNLSLQIGRLAWNVMLPVSFLALVGLKSASERRENRRRRARA